MNNVCMPYAQLYSGDAIILESLESYMEKKGVTPTTVRQDEYIRYYESTRDVFYSDIVQRLPRVVPYINISAEDDDKACALKQALFKHMCNPDFLHIMMIYLRRESDSVIKGLIGALLCESIVNYLNEMHKLDDVDQENFKAAKKDDKKAEPPKTHVNEDIVSKMIETAKELLANEYAYIDTKCIGMDTMNKLATAAYIAMGNENTACALLESDLPITAEVLNEPYLTANNDKLARVYTGILRLQKADHVKLSVNQTKFVESLTKWIYKRLNDMDMNLCLQLLVYAYGSSYPAEYVKTCLIQPKDCGTQYPNLFQVARSMKIN